MLDHGVYARIDYPNAAYTDAWAINAAGDIVGSYTDVDGAAHGYLLRRGRFTSFDVPAALFTAGFGINAEGDIVGHFGAPPAGKMNGFLLRNGTFSTYDYPDPNLMTCGMGINAGEDTIVGHYQVGTLVHGFVLSEGVFTTRDDTSVLSPHRTFLLHSASSAVAGPNPGKGTIPAGGVK